MTVGEYLKNLLKQKEVSVTWLSNELGLKSRNVLYRVFSDYYSDDKTREVIERIYKIVFFSDAEKAKIGELLNIGVTSRQITESRNILSGIYKDPSYGKFGTVHGGMHINFSDILKHAAPHESVVFMAGVSDARIIGDIDSFHGNSEKTAAYNYFHFSQRNMTCHEITALITLMGHKNYTPLLTRNVDFRGVFILYKTKSEYRGIKLELFQNDYLFLETPVSEEFYNPIIYKKDIFNDLCEPVKKPGSRVVDYIDIIKDSIIFDNTETYFSEGAPCFGNLPYNIVYDMFKDINFFGFPKDHPYVVKLINMFISRQKSFMENPAAKKLFLFDYDSIKRMMQTGLSFDHAEHFKPMTQKQLKDYFDSLIKTAKERPDKIRFRFTKVPLKRPFVYGIDTMLYSYISDSGYTDGFFIMLRNKALFDVMNDFMPYVWDEYTMSDEESAKLLAQMSDEYIKP